MKHIFGTIDGDGFHGTPLGVITEECIRKIPEIHDDAEIWNMVVMPNHIHLVIAINDKKHRTSGLNREASKRLGCLKPPIYGTSVRDYHHNSRLAVIIGNFKAAVTRFARNRLKEAAPIWHSRFHEHIIRHQNAYENIMNYKDHNVETWHTDCFHPSRPCESSDRR